MKFRSLSLLTAIISGTWAAPSSDYIPQDARAVAPSSGFAGQEGGTSGGSAATPEFIYTASSINDLNGALKQSNTTPSIILVKGTIDASDGKPFQNYADQKARGLIIVPSHTTIFGLGNATIVNGNFYLKDSENIIIRNLNIITPVDVEPHYEKGDGWNAEWDGITIDNSHHIWADHLTMSDGNFTDDMYHTKNGELYTQHDGLLDMKRGSDFITLSYNYFNHHDKTNLIGHSDSNGEQDSGKLRVTIHDCIYESIEQCAPRVRFGKVHSYNNHFIDDASKTAKNYRYQYSLGIGHKGSILSENNQFDISGLKSNCKIVNTFKKDGTFADKGSNFLNSPWNYTACSKLPEPDWKVPYNYTLLSTDRVAGHVRAKAGEGKF